MIIFYPKALHEARTHHIFIADRALLMDVNFTQQGFHNFSGQTIDRVFYDRVDRY